MSLSEFASYDFPDTPEDFHKKPIAFKVLKTTGVLQCDDGGYRDQSVHDRGERIVRIDGEIFCRPIYSGIDEVTGGFDANLCLPGGTEDGGMYARRSMLEALKVGNRYLAERYGDMQVGVVDPFRSNERQSLGFSRLAIQALDGNQNPDIETLFNAGVTADNTFSLIRATRTAPQYLEFVRDMALTQEVKDLAQASGKDAMSVATILADVCANLRKASKTFSTAPATPLNMDLSLNGNNNAHAGAHAVDAFLYDSKGNMLNGQVPYDWMGGPEASMDYLENDANLARYNAKVKANPVLRRHLEKQGITGEVTEKQWQFWKQVQRIMYHTFHRIGATFFSDTQANQDSPDFFGGENWHIEAGNVAYDVATRKPLYVGTAAKFVRDGGNPGHTLQKYGPNVPATSGGDAGHAQLIKRGILAA